MTARYNPAFQTLISMAVDVVAARTQDCARATGELRFAWDRLETLEQHRDHTEKAYQTASATGIDISRLRNHQSFVARLDQAISMQRDKVSSLQQSVLAARKRLREAERKRLGYNILEDRQMAVQRQAHEKRDQKNTDEHAAMMARRKLHLQS
jgi:flagellar FliJ protein